MGPDDPDGSPAAGSTRDLLHALRTLSIALDRSSDALAAGHRITANDTMILTALGDAGPLRPVELAHALGASSGTITSMLDRLEAAGFVRRVPNPDDRRSTLVVPESSGAGSSLVELRARLGALMEQRFPAERRAVTAAALRDLAAVLEEAASGAGAAVAPGTPDS